MNFFGIELDEDKNENLTGEGVISKESSRVWVLVIQTNEELVVAREARQLLASRS